MKITQIKTNAEIRKILKDKSPENFNTRMALMETLPKEVGTQINTKLWDAEERLQKYTRSRLYLDKVRSFCNQSGHSDVHPFEVVRVVSPRCVEIRAMDTKQTVFPKQFIPGGFSAHCADNQNQKYEYTSNPENSISKIYLSSRGWGLGKFHMANEPFKHYDYNF